MDQAVVSYLCLLYLVDQGLYICRNEGGDKLFLSTLKRGSSTQQDVSWGAGGGARGGSEQGREAWGEQGGATGCCCWTGEEKASRLCAAFKIVMVRTRITNHPHIPEISIPFLPHLYPLLSSPPPLPSPTPHTLSPIPLHPSHPHSSHCPPYPEPHPTPPLTLTPFFLPFVPTPVLHSILHTPFPTLTPTPLVLTPSGRRGCEALPPVGEPRVHPLLSDPLCVPLRTSHH